jgi:hypothetical protein
VKTFLLAGKVFVVFILCDFTAAAATITVTNPADSGAGTLRQALVDAQNGDRITFNLGGSATISLTSDELVINKEIVIIGPGANLLTIARASGAARFRIFHVTEGHTVTIQGLTITNGSRFDGAGIYNRHSNLTVNNCVITGNAVDQRVNGGGITNDGEISGIASLTINNSTISGNNLENPNGIATFGGGIFNYGIHGSATVTINNSTISNNKAFQGAGLFNDGGVTNSAAVVTINNSNFSNNTADQYAGAIVNEGNEGGQATLIVTNSTFAGNSGWVPGTDCDCTPGGGTIYNDGAGQAGAILEVGNAIFKGGIPNQRNILNQSGAVISDGYNLTNDAGVVNMSGGVGGFNAPTDLINTDPMLDPAGLHNNGGPTQTIALLSGSPAINSGDPNAPARDQRYYLRNTQPDRGAFEFGGTIAPVTSVSRKSHGAAGSFDVDLPLNTNAGIECRSGGSNGDYQLIMTFATSVTLAGASVTSGVGNVSNTNVTGSQVTVNLAGVVNAQRIELTLSGVSDGANTNDARIPMGVLLGDANENGTVNAADVGLTKSHIGEPILNSNFRADINASGDINATDAALVKSRLGTSLP